MNRKEVLRLRAKKWREDNPEKVKAAKKKYRKLNPSQGRDYSQRWRYENPEKAQKVAREYSQRNREAIQLKCKLRKRHNKDKVIELMGGKCSDCDGVFHRSAYDLHHLDPTLKDITPAQLMAYSWANIKKEVKKCVLLCANCHRTRHSKEED